MTFFPMDACRSEVTSCLNIQSGEVIPNYNPFEVRISWVDGCARILGEDEQSLAPLLLVGMMEVMMIISLWLRAVFGDIWILGHDALDFKDMVPGLRC